MDTTNRYYRGAIFYTASALESFINFIGDTFEKGSVFEPYERAFITDRRFGYDRGHISTLNAVEFHRIEDKLRFLLTKFVPNFDFVSDASWSRLLQFKKFRDSIVHPRHTEDEIDVDEYAKQAETGLSSAIPIIDVLCRGIFHKPLRNRILDLIP